MKKWLVSSSVLVVLIVLAVITVQAKPNAPGEDLSTGFTYQGQLNLDGQPVDNTCDLQFSLYDDELGTTQVGSTQTITEVQVSGGLFTVRLDFGTGAFQGDARWLGVQVQCQGDAGYANLGLQALTAAPYALALPGLWTQQNATSPNLIGGYSGNSVAAGVVGAAIGGGGNVEYPNRVLYNYATIGGGQDNTTSGVYAVIGGGLGNTAYYYATVGGGDGNTASDSYATVGGGAGNAAGDYAATVGGGTHNNASHNYATIGGGESNVASGTRSAIGGGRNNAASGDYATIPGGYWNVAGGIGAFVGGGGYDGSTNDGNQALGNAATIGGGLGNVITTTGDYATVGGGHDNAANGDSSTVGGGDHNTASGWAATIGGGVDNTANNLHTTIGGGHSNAASGIGATVGGGGYDGIAYDGNEALGNAATIGGGVGNIVLGGVYYATIGGGYSNVASGGAATVGGGEDNTANGAYATVPGGRDNVASGDYSFAAGRRAQANHDGAIILADSNDFDFASLAANTFKVRATGGIRFVLGIDGSGDPTWSCLVQDGSSWSCSSDRNLKENLDLVDGSEVLQRLAEMPIYTWNGKGQDPALRHMGPMAQDFFAAFNLGGDDTHIATVDLDGVTLAAIQGLYAQNQVLEMENAGLHQRVDDLEARLSALEDQVAGGSAASPIQIKLLPGAGLFLVGGVGLWLVCSRQHSEFIKWEDER